MHTHMTTYAPTTNPTDSNPKSACSGHCSAASPTHVNYRDGDRYGDNEVYVGFSAKRSIKICNPNTMRAATIGSQHAIKTGRKDTNSSGRLCLCVDDVGGKKIVENAAAVCVRTPRGWREHTHAHDNIEWCIHTSIPFAACLLMLLHYHNGYGVWYQC